MDSKYSNARQYCHYAVLRIMQNKEAFKELLKSPQNIVITTHINPDADALGSSLGISLALSKLGHKIKVIVPNDYPNFLCWMKGQEMVVIYEYKKEQCKQLVDKADIIFSLDYSSLNRIGELGELVRSAKATKVLIDHHQEPEDFADFMEWDTGAAATAELIYDLLVDIGWKNLIDSDSADCLYAGIMTDTGGFKHPNTTKNVHQVVSQLIDLGAKTSQVSKSIYDNNSVDRLRLLGYALNERLKVLSQYNAAYIMLTEADLENFNSKTGDTEGLVNYALSIKGVSIAALFSERKDLIKISFRSEGEFSVNELARDHFEGGGHNNAAGGKSTMSIEETVRKFERILENYKDKLISKPEGLNV